MKTLHVIISNKVATYLQRDGYIVCGNADNQIEFTFDKEWDAYERKTARFIWGGKPVDVEFSGNVCPVPIVANTEQLKVGVYVENLSTTTSAVIPCRLSVLCDSKTEAEGKVVIPDGTPVLGEATITENGEHYPGDGYDGFYKVTVKVAEGGEIPEGYIKPTGTKVITENGPHNVAEFASVEVNVPTGSGEDIPEFTEVEGFDVFLDEADEGTITVAYSAPQDVKLPAPSAGVAARLASVDDDNFIPSNIKKGVSIFGMTGNYEGEGSATPTQEKSVTITENGTTEVLPDAGFALSKVTINANVKQNYCLVRFYNDDRTTLLYEVLVPYGSSAVYAGDAPVSSLGADYTFAGFEPSTANVTADMDCYAVYDEPVAPEVGSLDSTSWADISAISAEGTAANYFAVGDTKSLALNGKVGTVTINETYYCYILGFDHNSAIEGNGIHFGTFKTADGIDIALTDSVYDADAYTTGNKFFNANHWGNSNRGGWAGCDMRYDILGSTDVQPSGYGASAGDNRVGYDATATCTTNPVANTLMAALPADLRAVMKPITKYTDGKGNSQGDVPANVIATIDYLPLLAEFEIFGVQKYANKYEQEKQQQYAYYAAGNSKIKYRSLETTKTCQWWQRSCYPGGANAFCYVFSNGTADVRAVTRPQGIAPLFMV